MEAIRKLFDFTFDSGIKTEINLNHELDVFDLAGIKNDMLIINSQEHISSFETAVQKMFYSLPIDEVKDYRKYGSLDNTGLSFFKMFELSKHGKKNIRLGDRILFYDDAYYNAYCNSINTLVEPMSHSTKLHTNIWFGFKLVNPKLILFIYEDKDEYKPYLRDKKFEKLD